MDRIGLAKIGILALCLTCVVRGEGYLREKGLGNSRGGIFTQLHLHSLNNFGTQVDGVPMMIGGAGMTRVARRVRLGGGGGAAFHFPQQTQTEFALGFGGLVGEYAFERWLSLRILFGGGGYSVRSLDRSVDAGGGFVVIHPSLNLDTRLDRNLEIVTSVGYFIPNINALSGFTVSLGLMWGPGN